MSYATGINISINASRGLSVGNLDGYTVYFIQEQNPRVSAVYSSVDLGFDDDEHDLQEVYTYFEPLDTLEELAQRARAGSSSAYSNISELFDYSRTIEGSAATETSQISEVSALSNFSHDVSDLSSLLTFLQIPQAPQYDHSHTGDSNDADDERESLQAEEYPPLKKVRFNKKVLGDPTREVVDYDASELWGKRKNPSDTTETTKATTVGDAENNTRSTFSKSKGSGYEGGSSRKRLRLY